jgi:dTDP-4-dehydrorhamnose 3,5-epimerase
MSVVKMAANIAGVYVTELKQIADERGAVLHMLRCDSSDFTQFGECYFSEVLPSVIKAWKRHREQTQNLAVPVGCIRLVIYDDRDNSVTRGKIEILQLGRPDAYYRVRIPPNLWYGFTCTSDVPALLANCSDLPHDPSDCEIIEMDDKSIPYSWSSGINCNIGE